MDTLKREARKKKQKRSMVEVSLVMNAKSDFLFLWHLNYRFSSVLRSKIETRVYHLQREKMNISHLFFRVWLVASDISTYVHIDEVYRQMKQRHFDGIEDEKYQRKATTTSTGSSNRKTQKCIMYGRNKTALCVCYVYSVIRIQYTHPMRQSLRNGNDKITDWIHVFQARLLATE